jgi:hypothetical protein
LTAAGSRAAVAGARDERAQPTRAIRPESRESVSNLLHANPLCGQPASSARVRRSTALICGYTGNWSVPAMGEMDSVKDAAMFAKVHGQRPRGGPS